MKHNCGTCNWFECFYRQVDGIFRPVEVGECTHPIFDEVNVVTIDDECSTWTKKEN